MYPRQTHERAPLQIQQKTQARALRAGSMPSIEYPWVFEAKKLNI